jgi:NAD(P)-dependent dehydrogenase (short-subunit alcohol dehydrogenase family)
MKGLETLSNVTLLPLDVTDPESISQLFATIQAKLESLHDDDSNGDSSAGENGNRNSARANSEGRRGGGGGAGLDILVNNAGFGGILPASDTSNEVSKRMM